MKRRRGVLCFLACGLALLLTGCIWTRLLTLKHQFVDFDRFVQVHDRDGLSFNLLKPVLRTDDVRELLDSAPTTAISNGGRETWTWNFEKVSPPGETGDFGVGFTTSFEAGKLVRLSISDRFRTIMSKETILAMVRALGKGKVNKQQREMTSQLDAGAFGKKIEPLCRSHLVTLLGQPLSVSEAAFATIHHYEYRLKSPSLRPGQQRLARVHCTYTKTTERLTRLEMTCGRIRLNLVFDEKE